MATGNKKSAPKSATRIEPVEIPIKIKLSIDINTGSPKEISIEKISPEIQNQSLRDEEDQTAMDINTIILAVIHEGTIKPRDLSPGFSLTDDLGYDDDTLDFLHIALNNYVDHKKPGSKISQSEMVNCETVGNCIELVKDKI